MKIYNGIESYPEGSSPVIATIGNYDGVHLGHRAILDSMARSAKKKNLTSLVITFHPHPLSVVAPDRKPRLLQTRGQSLESFEAAGMDAVLILRFDDALAFLSGEAFFSEFLTGPVRLDEIHVGDNFRFGRGRHGDVELLTRIGEECGFRVVGVPGVRTGDLVISSSTIRGAVEEGSVELARKMLGRPFALVGEVVEGAGRGRTLQFPTANLEVENEMIPRRGVYVTEAVVLATRHGSVTNVGVRPTYGGESLVVETHILDLDADLYGERLELRFLARLRDEMRFPAPEALADQIARDRAAAVAYFHNQQIASI